MSQFWSETKPGQPPDASTGEQRPDRPRILVIDDNPAIHGDFRKILVDVDVVDPGDAELLAVEAAMFGEAAEAGDGVLFDIDTALQGEEGVSKVHDALLEGNPFAVAFIDMRMPPGIDGMETARLLWQVDPHVQVVFCTAYSDYTWEEMVDTLGAGDRWVILRKPFDPIEVRQLAQALSTKWELRRQNLRYVNGLEGKVQSRTAALEAANARLSEEIKQREQAERELRRAQKLEALGRLAAGIGHEINNPLAFLLCSAELAAEGVAQLRAGDASFSLEQLQEDLRNIQVGARRIRDIVKDMRLFCRPSDEERQLVDLSQVIDLASTMVANEIKSRARLVKDYDETLPVSGVSNRLEQVFVNLLLNAAQSIDAGNARINEVRVALRMEGSDTVVAEVSDTGGGIPTHIIDRVFDPFFTTKDVGEGTGLGLSICHGIVTDLGGDISIESAVGGGTQVSVRLPVARQQVETKPAAPDAVTEPTKPAPSSTRILLVDDEPLLLNSMRRQLRRYDVTICTSGREAVGLCRREDFDVILCDLMMDDWTGMDVYERLKRLRPGAERRIIFLTGGAFTSRAKQFVDEVDNACLAKPLDTDRLDVAIANSLEAG
jgi:signal transduction histidine kinase